MLWSMALRVVGRGSPHLLPFLILPMLKFLSPFVGGMECVFGEPNTQQEPSERSIRLTHW